MWQQVQRFGFGVHLSHLPMQSWGRRGGGRLGPNAIQSSYSHFMPQPQSIVWHLQYALHKALRQGTMQCQETRLMATDTINLPDEGGMQGCNCKCKGTENIQNLCPLFPLLWLNAFSFSNQIHNSQLLRVCRNNVWPVTQGAKLKAEVFASWGNQQQTGPQRFRGQDHRWPTSGPGGFLPPAA